MKYYTYYSHGGYKDLYLGNSEEQTEATYFVPMLEIWEAEVNPDAELIGKIERVKRLPQIVMLIDDYGSYNYPNECRTLMSHGGYKIFYRKCRGGKTVLAVRDIPGKKDFYGRNCPFNVMILAETPNEVKKLNKIAEYIRLNLQLFQKDISAMFIEDYEISGLRFELRKFNEWLNHAQQSTFDDPYDACYNFDAIFIVMEKKSLINTVLQEQSIPSSRLNIVYDLYDKTLNVNSSSDSFDSGIHPIGSYEDWDNWKSSSDFKFGKYHSFIETLKKKLKDIYDTITKLCERVNQLSCMATKIEQLEKRISALEEELKSLKSNNEEHNP